MKKASTKPKAAEKEQKDDDPVRGLEEMRACHPEIDKDIETLKKKLYALQCPICKHSKFLVLEGVFLNLMQDDPNDPEPLKKKFPSITVICQYCGFISQHARAVLRPESFTMQRSDTKD